jgi:hypothetical protein
LLDFSNADTSNNNFLTNFGGGIYAQNSGTFTLKSSTFSNLNHARSGGGVALGITQSEKPTIIPSNPTHEIENCTFTSNTANFGGGLYILDVDYLQIKGSVFQNNKVKYNNRTQNSGNGGAIFYTATGMYYYYMF